MASFLRGVREYITPVLQQSAFRERGVLTPQEFVAAGDQLVFRFPTWSWYGETNHNNLSYGGRLHCPAFYLLALMS